MTIIRKFFQHNWLATLYFNFRMLPFRQAIHLPFDFAHSVRFNSLKGKVRLEVDTPLHRAMVRFGGRGSDIFPRNETVLSINGTLLIKGDGVEIGNGASCVIGSDGCLILNRNVRIGARSKVYCSRRIVIGEQTGISWECQIFDTNFHQLQDVTTGNLLPFEGMVSIGTYCWISNRCSLMKGTQLPDRVIVASNSLLNKDYLAVAPNSLLAGMPARVVKTRVQRTLEE